MNKYLRKRLINLEKKVNEALSIKNNPIYLSQNNSPMINEQELADLIDSHRVYGST